MRGAHTTSRVWLTGAPEPATPHLLTSSIVIRAANVMMFSLLYWQLERGGPSGRAGEHRRRDWVFPQDQAAPFSTTDALPLTGRAKFAMMSESTISLVTLAVVAARAINVLGS